MSVTQHNANPADRILYQLRNETGTVESNALIISSITSKQLTFPADQLLLDVRYGPGAFFPNRQKASSMANSMTTLLCNEGIPTSHQLTDTSEPNGSSIGNALEIIETLAILKGSTSHEWRIKGLQTQRELVLRFFITLLNNTFPNIPKDTLYKIGCESIDSGKALNAFFDILHSHSVPASVIKSLRIDPWPVLLSNIHPFSLLSPQTGVISFIDQKKLGTIVNFVLGKEDKRFGLQLHKGLHDTIQAGELLAHVYAKTIDEALVHDLASCFKITTLPS